MGEDYRWNGLTSIHLPLIATLATDGCEERSKGRVDTRCASNRRGYIKTAMHGRTTVVLRADWSIWSSCGVGLRQRKSFRVTWSSSRAFTRIRSWLLYRFLTLSLCKGRIKILPCVFSGIIKMADTYFLYITCNFSLSIIRRNNLLM